MRGRLYRWASPAVSVVLLLVVIWDVGTGPLVHGFDAVDSRAVLAAAAVVFVTSVVSAWRWTVVARGLGVPIRLPAAVASYYGAVFLNLTVPSGVAGDVRRGISHGRAVHDVGRALRAVLWERAAGQAVQAVLTIAVLLALPSPARSFMPFVAVAAIAAAVGLLLVGRLPQDRRSRLARVRDLVVTDIRDGVLRRDALPAVALTSAVVVVGHAVTFLIAARAAGVTASISRLAPLALLALLAMVMPSVGGWGPREGATAWVFSAAGLGADRGAAVAVTYGVLVLVASLPGAIVLFAAWHPRRRFLRPRPPGRRVFHPKGAGDAASIPSTQQMTADARTGR